MELKFYLNKFAKVSSIENYCLKDLKKIQKQYEEFLERSEGVDPDFPTVSFGDSSKGKKIKGKNKVQAESELENYGENPQDSLGFLNLTK